jgi:hypothetical protein
MDGAINLFFFPVERLAVIRAVVARIAGLAEPFTNL